MKTQNKERLTLYQKNTDLKNEEKQPSLNLAYLKSTRGSSLERGYKTCQQFLF